jgi:hypothetical protein
LGSMAKITLQVTKRYNFVRSRPFCYTFADSFRFCITFVFPFPSLLNRCYQFQLLSSVHRYCVYYKEAELVFVGARNMTSLVCVDDWLTLADTCGFHTPKKMDHLNVYHHLVVTFISLLFISILLVEWCLFFI